MIGKFAAVEARAEKAIDKACFTPPATAPTCYDRIRPDTAGGWVSLAGFAIDGDHFEVFCGS